jgi:hypothetical protein
MPRDDYGAVPSGGKSNNPQKMRPNNSGDDMRMSRVMGVHSCARFATELAILFQGGGYCFSISQLGTFREE